MKAIENYFDIDYEIFEIVETPINSKSQDFENSSFQLKFINGSISKCPSKIKLKLDLLKNQSLLKKFEGETKASVSTRPTHENIEFELREIIGSLNVNFSQQFENRENLSQVEHSFQLFIKQYGDIESKKFTKYILSDFKLLFGDELTRKMITTGVFLQEIENRPNNKYLPFFSQVNSLENIFDFFRLKNILNLKFDLFSPLNSVEKVEINNIQPEIKSDYFKYIDKKNFKFIDKKDIQLNDFDAIFLFDYLNRWRSEGIGSTGKLIRRRGGEEIDTSVIDELESDFNTLINLVNNSNYEGKIFILTDFYSSKRVIKSIKKNGFERYYISAILTLGNYIEKDFNGSDLELIIIDNKIQSEIFIGSIDNKSDNLSLVLENYNNLKTSNKDIKNGFLCELSNYFSFNQLKKIWDYNEYGNSLSDFTTYSLSDVTSKIVEYKSVENEFDKHPNSLFFSYSTFLKTINVIGEDVVGPVTSGHQIVFQLVLDETKVLSSYLNRYFLDPNLGGLFVGSIENRDGSSIVFQSFKDILDINIFIPESLVVQKKITSLQEKANDISSRTSNLTSSTSELNELNDLVSKDILYYVNLLPFPLASMLWKYEAEQHNYYERYKSIQNFFESLSQLLVVFLLSSFKNNKDYFDENFEKFFGKPSSFYGFYKAASFGNWNTFLENLISFINKKSKQNLDNLNSLLSYPPIEWMSMISDEKVLANLKNMSSIRNKYPFMHGGYANPPKYKKALSDVEELLWDILPILEKGFSKSVIVKPDTFIYDEPKFTGIVTYLKGNNIPFKTHEIQIEIPLNHKELYFYHLGNGRPIKIIPFIRFIEEKNRFCLFSQYTVNGYKYISYHYQDDDNDELSPPENPEELENIINKLKSLTPKY